MATTISELLVKVTPSGIGETSDGLEDVQEQFEDTAESVDESAGEMESFSEQFEGSMAAIVAGLATAAAGLLSQVPVIQESMTGLGAVLQALSFKIDRQLRPSLSKMNRDLFKLANRISKAESTSEAFGTALLGIPLTAQIGAMRDLSDAVNAFGTELVTLPLQTYESLFNGLESAIDSAASTWDDWSASIKSKLPSIKSMVNKSIEWLNKLPNVNIDKIGGSGKQSGGDGRQSTPNRWPDSTGPRGGGSLAKPTTTRSERQQIRGLNRLVAALQNNQQTTTLEVDGQTVAEQTKPFLGDGTTNRGRFGPQ